MTADALTENDHVSSQFSQPQNSVTLYCGDNMVSLTALANNSIDSIVTDPPYGLSAHDQGDIEAALAAWLDGREFLTKKRGFMGKTWDSFVPGPEIWKEALRVLKPGGHIVCFAGSRTQDLMAISLRLGGFEVRDTLMWLYGTGFPKSHDVSKAIDKELGAVRPVIGHSSGGIAGGTGEFTAGNGGTVRYKADFDITAPASPEAIAWQGWGTALKPAFEPIILARKPLEGTVVANVQEHRTGAINIDGCRVALPQEDANYIAERVGGVNNTRSIGGTGILNGGAVADRSPYDASKGRWPANVLHDGSDEVEAAFAVYGEKKSGVPGVRRKEHETNSMLGSLNLLGTTETGYADSGSVSRFFYCAKASKKDRGGSAHPTVKPNSLMRWLVKLVTPPGGVVLDPFAGSGSTGVAAVEEGFSVILMEREAAYQADIRRRFTGAQALTVVSAPSSQTQPKS